MTAYCLTKVDLDNYWINQVYMPMKNLDCVERISNVFRNVHSSIRDLLGRCVDWVVNRPD